MMPRRTGTFWWKPRKDIFERSGLPVQELSFIWQALHDLTSGDVFSSLPLRKKGAMFVRKALSQNDQRLQEEVLFSKQFDSNFVQKDIESYSKGKIPTRITWNFNDMRTR